MPTKLNELYDSLFKDPKFKSEPLKKAISEFVGFSIAPMERSKHELLDQFIQCLTPNTTLFQKGRDVYKNQAFLFSHEK